MKPTANIPCWEIVQCIGTADCPARSCPDIPCWEIAALLDAGASAFSICEECIVYLAKTGNPVLSPDELEEILRMRNILWYIDRCPAFDRRPRPGGNCRQEGKEGKPEHALRPDVNG